MDQFPHLDALINQGHVHQIMGKLRWADGGQISHEPEESWADAIVQGLPKDNGTTATEDKTKNMYFVKVNREADDASSDSQEGLGWTSGAAAVHNLQTYGVN